MEIRSNKIGDIRAHYQRELYGTYDDQEADKLLFLIFEAYLGISRAKILMDREQLVGPAELLKIRSAVNELIKEKPIQYILGNTEFLGLNFLVNSKVLIPRPETEELIELVLKSEKIGKKQIVLDVGTGSGCIAITLKHLRPELNLTAIDVSEFALEIARKNSLLNHVDVNFKQLDFLDENNFNKLGTFDLVVSNPPYIPNQEKIEMKNNVLNFEPSLALFVPNEDPLLFYKALAGFAKTHLNRGGKLFCEINPNYAGDLEELLLSMKFKSVQLHKDLNDKLRFISCQSK